MVQYSIVFVVFEEKCPKNMYEEKEKKNMNGARNRTCVRLRQDQ